MQSIAPAAGVVPARAHAHAAAASMVNAFDYVNQTPVPISAHALSSTKDAVLRTAVTNASRVMTFLHDTFGRNGVDGHGQKLDVVVHVTQPEDWGLGMPDTGGDDARGAAHGLRRGATAEVPMNNAFWDSESAKMYLGDGDGAMFTPLGGSVDIIAHETGHAVLDSEVKMSFDPTESPTAPQQGALHESFGDVLGALIEGDWQIGEDTFTPGTPGDAIRDLSKPEQFTDMREVGSETEPHLLADIPNLAAYRAAQA
ncbi:MAG: M4 family metallopeptidase, partial [Thermoleophilia bacterium]|nr:M4 family metallopeptidase [Thermoleophilia bacterium]